MGFRHDNVGHKDGRHLSFLLPLEKLLSKDNMTKATCKRKYLIWVPVSRGLDSMAAAGSRWA